MTGDATLTSKEKTKTMLLLGTRVRVYLPKKEMTADSIRQFEGMKTVITHMHQTPVCGLWQYNLSGCVSKCGLPYWFCEDWLVPIIENEVTEA